MTNRYNVWIHQQYAINHDAEYTTWEEAKAAADRLNDRRDDKPWRVWDKSVYPPLDVTDKNPEIEKEEPPVTDRYSVWETADRALTEGAEHATIDAAIAERNDLLTDAYVEQRDWRIWDHHTYPPTDVTDSVTTADSDTNPSVFAPIRPVDTEGWQYQGEEIPDDVVLAFAKRDYLIEHVRDEEDGPRYNRCHVRNREGKSLEYKPGQWIVWAQYAGKWTIINNSRYVIDWTALD